MTFEFDLTAHNRAGLDERLDRLDLTATVYHVSVKPKKSKRSGLQNNAYWQFVKEFANHFGYDKDFTHDLLRYKFLYKVVDFDGQEARQLLSTTKLNTKDMADYLDNCMRWASGNGFYFEL